MQKPSIPKGTRDFSPVEMVKREFIFDNIRSIFKRYGFAPIETPAMENLTTLLGKYGDEGDKLLFRILNSGDYLGNVNTDNFKFSSSELSPMICEKGLRYDLTVPFARYVVQYRNDITFPFKRYQMQPVWRADRPQKGRYREFFQCDVDVVGSDSLLNELELVQIIEDVFSKLKINALVKINNRKILAGIAEVVGLADRLTDITVAIDKLDKIGFDSVIAELKEKGFPDASVKKIAPFLKMKGGNIELIVNLKNLLSGSSIGMLGIQEIETLFTYLTESSVKINFEIDLTLARGLNYYTGSIFEVKSVDVQIGSICGGGRYDDLTGIFGMPGVSGVGISFGADRIYDVMTQLKLFPAEVNEGTQVMFVNFGPAEEKYCLQMVRRLRNAGISAEIYPEQSKLKKQLTYANSKAIPFVVLIGADEIAGNKIALKDMIKGDQTETSIEDLIIRLLERNS